MTPAKSNQLHIVNSVPSGVLVKTLRGLRPCPKIQKWQLPNMRLGCSSQRSRDVESNPVAAFHNKEAPVRDILSSASAKKLVPSWPHQYEESRTRPRIRPCRRRTGSLGPLPTWLAGRMGLPRPLTAKDGWKGGNGTLLKTLRSFHH